MAQITVPVQASVRRSGQPVTDEQTAEVACLAMGPLDVTLDGPVDAESGVWTVGLPLPLANRLAFAGWLRVESANGVWVIEAEMP